MYGRLRAVCAAKVLRCPWPHVGIGRQAAKDQYQRTLRNTQLAPTSTALQSLVNQPAESIAQVRRLPGSIKAVVPARLQLLCLPDAGCGVAQGLRAQVTRTAKLACTYPQPPERPAPTFHMADSVNHLPNAPASLPLHPTLLRPTGGAHQPAGQPAGHAGGHAAHGRPAGRRPHLQLRGGGLRRGGNAAGGRGANTSPAQLARESAACGRGKAVGFWACSVVWPASPLNHLPCRPPL